MPLTAKQLSDHGKRLTDDDFLTTLTDQQVLDYYNHYKDLEPDCGVRSIIFKRELQRRKGKILNYKTNDVDLGRTIAEFDSK